MEALLLLLPKIFMWIGAGVTTASTIVKITPTQKDNKALGKVIKVLDVISVFNPNGTKLKKVK